jgi:hypothetical protein
LSKNDEELPSSESDICANTGLYITVAQDRVSINEIANTIEASEQVLTLLDSSRHYLKS